MRFHFYGKSDHMRFDITPVIDVVFLLIIFFMIICQFIVAENFEVEVPDDISSAIKAENADDQTTAVTVMFTEGGKVDYAVGSEIINAREDSDIAAKIAEKIDRQLANLDSNKRIVSIRIDKNIPFIYSKNALAGISQSSATDIKLSVISRKMNK